METRTPQAKEVSIPFIAGQWSLRKPRHARRRNGARFNPLHCGAVVASRPPPPHGEGQGGFNPLHCGAVVASIRPVRGGRRGAGVSIPFIAGQWSLPRLALAWNGRVSPMFQSPSLRGSGRFERPRLSWNPALLVSIPFIAGQWSLRTQLAKRGSPKVSFNPLHCGAVVASPAARCGPLVRPPSFNPLHCGAVVASRSGGDRRCQHDEFQSPSLRGSGRFQPTTALVIAGAIMFQSPSLRGSGRFAVIALGDEGDQGFQSPSLRGSGRFGRGTGRRHPDLAVFQSPSLRGSGRFWDGSPKGLTSPGFNPLHCGAVVAS